MQPMRCAALLLLLVASACSLTPRAAAQVGGSATCTLALQGVPGAAAGVPPSLQFACSGSPVLAAANSTALGLAPGAAFPGVTWDPDGCGGAAAVCLLALCGGARVAIRDALVADVALAPLTSDLSTKNSSKVANMHALCVRGTARVELIGGRFTRNRNASAVAVTDTAMLDINGGAVFADNNGQTAPLWAGANASLAVGGGVRFTGNSVGTPYDNSSLLFRGGALCVSGSVRLRLEGPVTFRSNTAAYGGAIALHGAVTATITGPDCLFMQNNARCGAGAPVMLKAWSRAMEGDA
jgi:predicted outer membrane repeat protein